MELREQTWVEVAREWHAEQEWLSLDSLKVSGLPGESSECCASIDWLSCVSLRNILFYTTPGDNKERGTGDSAAVICMDLK